MTDRRVQQGHTAKHLFAILRQPKRETRRGRAALVKKGEQVGRQSPTGFIRVSIAGNDTIGKQLNLFGDHSLV